MYAYGKFRCIWAPHAQLIIFKLNICWPKTKWTKCKCKCVCVRFEQISLFTGDYPALGAGAIGEWSTGLIRFWSKCLGLRDQGGIWSKWRRVNSSQGCVRGSRRIYVFTVQSAQESKTISERKESLGNCVSNDAYIGLRANCHDYLVDLV